MPLGEPKTKLRQETTGCGQDHTEGIITKILTNPPSPRSQAVPIGGARDTSRHQSTPSSERHLLIRLMLEGVGGQMRAPQRASAVIFDAKERDNWLPEWVCGRGGRWYDRRTGSSTGATLLRGRLGASTRDVDVKTPAQGRRGDADIQARVPAEGSFCHGNVGSVDRLRVCLQRTMLGEAAPRWVFSLGGTPCSGCAAWYSTFQMETGHSRRRIHRRCIEGSAARRRTAMSENCVAVKAELSRTEQVFAAALGERRRWSFPGS